MFKDTPLTTFDTSKLKYLPKMYTFLLNLKLKFELYIKSCLEKAQALIRNESLINKRGPLRHIERNIK